MRRLALLELCRQYSLGTTGNMQDFRDKLTEFSESILRWKWYVLLIFVFLFVESCYSLIPGARRAHRGVREGGITKSRQVKNEHTTALQKPSKKSKKLKLSAMRRDKMMGTPADGLGGPQVFAAERSKDMRTLEEKQNLQIWVSDTDPLPSLENSLYHFQAKRYRRAHPYIPLEEIQKRLKAKAEAEAAKNAHSVGVHSFF